MLQKRLNSFKFAFAGIKELFLTEPNAKVHLFVAVIVIIAGIFLSFSATEWILIIFAIAFVFVTEAINTALEAAVDLITQDIHPLAKKAKDIAAGAVLIAAVAAVLIGSIVVFPKIYLFF